MIIGLTGGSGTGKSLAAEFFRSAGALVLDCDKIGHEILNPGGSAVDEVYSAFGDSVMEDGAISRKKLGDIVFRDEQKRGILNSITHKYIKDEVQNKIHQTENPIIVVDGALLFESGFDSFCDCMLVISAPREVRVNRIMKRDGISRTSAEARLSAQTSPEELENKADAVIKNDGSPEALYEKLREWMKKFGEKAKKT